MIFLYMDLDIKIISKNVLNIFHMREKGNRKKLMTED